MYTSLLTVFISCLSVINTVMGHFVNIVKELRRKLSPGQLGLALVYSTDKEYNERWIDGRSF